MKIWATFWRMNRRENQQRDIFHLLHTGERCRDTAGDCDACLDYDEQVHRVNDERYLEETE